MKLSRKSLDETSFSLFEVGLTSVPDVAIFQLQLSYPIHSELDKKKSTCAGSLIQ